MASTPDEDQGRVAGPGNGTQEQDPSRRHVLGGMLDSWGELTADEQKAMAMVLALALLGIGGMMWHAARRAETNERNVGSAAAAVEKGTSGAAGAPAETAARKGGYRR